MSQSTECDRNGFSSEGVPWENPEGNPAGSTPVLSEKERDRTGEPEEPRETRIVHQLRDALTERGAMFRFDSDSWHEAVFELLNKGYSHQEIEVACRYSQADEFWAAKVNDLPSIARYHESLIDQARRWYNGQLASTDPNVTNTSAYGSNRSPEEWYRIYRNLLDRESWTDDEVRQMAYEQATA